jgi:serine phosphatase RsbU (regulator of sigma subunit)/Zn-finger nucleic acid-binding protein
MPEGRSIIRSWHYCFDAKKVEVDGDSVSYHFFKDGPTLWIDGPEFSKLKTTGLREYPPPILRCPRCCDILLIEVVFPGNPDTTSFQCRRCNGILIRLLPSDPAYGLFTGETGLTRFLNAVLDDLRNLWQRQSSHRLPETFTVERKTATEHSCPHCGHGLSCYRVSDSLTHASSDFDLCDRCHGIWLDREDLLKPEARHTMLSLSADLDSLITSDRTCPKCCDANLSTMKFKGIDIDVDFCPSCKGSWLDAGELHGFCDYLQKYDHDVIDALIDNDIFRHPQICGIVKRFSHIMHAKCAQIDQQDNELSEAYRTQRNLLGSHGALLAERPRLFGEYEIDWFWDSALMVGGDYFGIIRYTDADGGENLGICIADACGKGIPASLLMAYVDALFDTSVPRVGSPAELCKKMNGHIFANTSSDRFVTFFHGVLNLATHQFTFCNAGHNRPFFLSASGISTLDTEGAALGLFEESDYEEKSVRLSAGDRILLYTDGAVELENNAGEEFGFDRLRQAFHRYSHEPVATTMSRIVGDLRDFKPVIDPVRRAHRDDLTLLLLARLMGPSVESSVSDSPPA